MSLALCRLLVKLVCYHDLVGDILGKGRNPEQLLDIVESEQEVDMLITLGLADMRAVNPIWDLMHSDKIPALRAQVVDKLGTISTEERD